MNFSFREGGWLWSTKNLSCSTIFEISTWNFGTRHMDLGEKTVGSNFWILDFGFFWKFLKKILAFLFSKISKKIQNPKFKNLILQFVPARSKDLVPKFQVDISKIVEEDRFLVLRSRPLARTEKFTFKVILLVF